MAALSDKTGMQKLIEYADQIGLHYTPLTSEEVDALANEPFAYEPDTIIEDRAGKVSGSYQYFSGIKKKTEEPIGWALIAIGPSRDGQPIELRDWLAIPKGEGWAVRTEITRAAVSDVMEPGDIAYHRAENGVVRLARVLAVDKNGYPSSLMLRGVVFDPRDTDNVWLKDKDRQPAARSFYEDGNDRFEKLWTYSTQAGKRMGILARDAAKVAETNPATDRAKIAALRDDAEFLASIDRARAKRVEKKDPKRRR